MGKRNLEPEIDDLHEQVNMLETMMTSVVDMLEAKALLRMKNGSGRSRRI